MNENNIIMQCCSVLAMKVGKNSLQFSPSVGCRTMSLYKALNICINFCVITATNSHDNDNIFAENILK